MNLSAQECNSGPKTIAKSAGDPTRCVRRTWAFSNARTAFKALLKETCSGRVRSILLPSYIGWSSREGSGVFDPVRELGLEATFYKVSRDLRVDLEDFERCTRQQEFAAIVLIHYFGFVDPGYTVLVDIARKNGAIVIEDEAHAMLTDLVCGGAGRLGDACLFSAHKLLPLSRGGLLVANSAEAHLHNAEQDEEKIDLRNFDLWDIARARRANSEHLARSLLEFGPELSPLFSEIPPNVVPQSYPVILRGESRDEIYHRMNARGFGVVSLYHTLIEEVRAPQFADSHWLSRHILNLPVHQDVSPEGLDLLVHELREVIAEIS